MNETTYSTDQAAKSLGTTNGYLRAWLKRYPEFAPSKINGEYIWTFEDIERVRHEIAHEVTLCM